MKSLFCKHMYESEERPVIDCTTCSFHEHVEFVKLDSKNKTVEKVHTCFKTIGMDNKRLPNLVACKLWTQKRKPKNCLKCGKPKEKLPKAFTIEPQ